MKKKQNAISRRRFLKFAGGSAAAATLFSTGGCSWGELFASTSDAADTFKVGAQKFKVTLCGGCSGGCSLVVRLVDSRAVGIRGNPLYPVNRGHVCPKGLARLQNLYNPGRIRSPLKRVGHRGDDRWEEIGWDEALGEVASNLSDLRTRDLAHQVVLLADNIDGIDMDLAERFMAAYGSPNFIANRPGDLTRASLRSLYGDSYAVGYDLENSNYLLCFDDLIGTGTSPVWAQGVFGYLRQERKGVRSKIVYVGSRMNLTAANADEWISVRPGSEGALALGIAHIIIRDDLLDREFIDKYSHGFDAWDHAGRRYSGFKDHVLDNYPPRRVSEITGVPLHTISKIASEFTRFRPAVAVAGQRSTDTTNSFHNVAAIHALNGLVGSIDSRGGVINQKGAPLAEWPTVDLDHHAEQSRNQPRLDSLSQTDFWFRASNQQVCLEAMANREPHPVDVLINCAANPIYREWSGSGYNRSYDQVKLIVSLTSFMDDTARYSDLILPTRVDFESWGYGDTVSGTSIRSHLALRQPVVEPLQDTLQPGDVFIRLAKLLEGTTSTSMPWRDSREALRSRLKGIAEANEGMITAGSLEKEWLQSLAGLGWRSPGFTDTNDLQKQLSEKGGWWNPLDDHGRWKRSFSTPSGKFEFASLALMEAFASAFKENKDPLEDARRSLKLAASKDELILPHYEPPEFDGDQTSYPLILIPYLTTGLGSGEGANLPLMQEFIDPLYSTTWETVIELHRDTARSIGIEDGANVWVESPNGRVLCRAEVNMLNRPDVACMALGLGHQGYGQFANRIGVNPKTIMTKQFDRMDDSPALVATRVRVFKAREE